ncbi:tyrosine-type recombinase/integrase [Parachlamydia acanthamoebae]|uniref:tyrosine-type recombinase/integrase n=1 Tax=Parachlamydia acanthamoebae TaxID=83552 RepID=UPI0024E21A83|nr:site-specific integrase [Parachlamydia acanthamoebae]
MGSIRELPIKNGGNSYHAEVRLKGFPPQRRVCRTKTQAKQWIQDTEAAIRDGRFKNQSKSRKHTVAEMIDRFATTIPQHPIYYPKKVQLLNRWKEELGHLLLSELSAAHVAIVRDKLLAETTSKKAFRSPSTVNRYLTAFSKVLAVAVKEWEWLEENPMIKISKPKESLGRDRFLDRDEINRLLDACKLSSNSNLYLIVSLAIFTAMRYGEIINLKWEDINFEQGFITLQHTKNGERRIVFITPEVASILRDCASYGNKGSLFKSKRKSTSALPLSIRKSFANALKTANINNCRFHDLRHTSASHLAMNGATQGELMAILGHKTPAMTRRYAHYSQNHLVNLMDKVHKNLKKDK